MNKNMRKMYTEEQLVDIISKHGKTGILVGDFEDENPFNYIILPNIQKINDTGIYTCRCIGFDGIEFMGIEHNVKIDFPNERIYINDTPLTLTDWDVQLMDVLTGGYILDL